ncbi:ABC transporter ATP-binding protein [Pontibacillus litoralis]|uniref:Spermidine/putrescine ABC transporter ATP-binding protein n=1 Tax=Pontibacillus litoralis JSM 072002 TaxID=1385512 RepID=A0A0A5G6H0_9BACI|nr:ABC transporter ATP-binding protein [Pontibacillus litoralis]KGX86768.1 spermidine/putrescine ABC transporter ATP-binding protein [Pontibacillus litoralis JSM 072002]
MISIENVTKKYVNKTALKNVNMQFEKGKVTGIVGENGSGKSTTLKLMAGLIYPTSGKVLIDDKQARRLSSNKVAYMSELESFYSYFTVKDAIDYFASQFTDFERGQAEEIVSFMNLELNQKVKHLSKGNRGRLKIAITLARRAPYILLDEPFSGLDPMVRNSIVKGLIKFIDLEKQTLIVTTHEILEIEPILDDAIVIKGGEILARESVEDIRENGQSVVEWMERKYREERRK